MSYVAVIVLNVIFSLASVVLKFASTSMGVNGFFRIKTLAMLAGYFSIMAVYAVLWQMFIKKVPLTVAYLCKGTLMLWALLWAVIFFEEMVTAFNIAGIAVILAGIFLVIRYE